MSAVTRTANSGFPTSDVVMRISVNETLDNLMFRCPVTGEDFNSGFRTSQVDLSGVPLTATVHTRCPCGQTHTLRFADGWIKQSKAAAPPANERDARRNQRLF